MRVLTPRNRDDAAGMKQENKFQRITLISLRSPTSGASRLGKLFPREVKISIFYNERERECRRIDSLTSVTRTETGSHVGEKKERNKIVKILILYLWIVFNQHFLKLFSTIIITKLYKTFFFAK